MMGKRHFALMTVTAMALSLSACGGGGLFNRNAPEDFAVTRAAPLVVPPDFSLVPPKAGAPRPMEVDSQKQAMEALFGPGVRVPPKSAGETSLLQNVPAASDMNSLAIRSQVGDPQTQVVNKGVYVRTLVDAPAGNSPESVASIKIDG